MVDYINARQRGQTPRTVSGQQPDAIVRINGIDYARRLGLTSDLPPYLPLALGAGEATLLEMDAKTGQVLWETTVDDVKKGYSTTVAPLIAKNLQFKFFIVYHLTAVDRQRAQGALQHMLERNQLAHRICDRYALHDIVAAHERVESGKAIGNVVVGRD